MWRGRDGGGHSIAYNGSRCPTVPRSVLYVSPHADDVAFSAAAQLARDVAAGARATLLTLFEPPEPERRGEDEAFARAAGVELVRGEWPDAIVRRRRYRSPAQLFAPMRADEAPLVEAVRATLQARVDAGARRVVAPLGVGGHVDHQMAHAACRALVGADVAYYEDTPYVLTPFQLPRRFARLGAAPSQRRAASATRRCRAAACAPSSAPRPTRGWRRRSSRSASVRACASSRSRRS